MWFALIALAILTVACAGIQKFPPRVDYWTDEPDLGDAMLQAADEWAMAGVEIALHVTVNEKPKSKCMVIKRAPRDKLPQCCRMDDDFRGDGCTNVNDDWQWDGVYVADDVTDPERIKIIMLHELGHIIASERGHIDPALVGIMHPNGNARHPTEADIEFMRERTIVLEPEEVA